MKEEREVDVAPTVRPPKRDQRGFTLLELVLVLILAGILSGVLAGIFSGALGVWTDAQREADISRQLTLATERWVRDMRMATEKPHQADDLAAGECRLVFTKKILNGATREVIYEYRTADGYLRRNGVPLAKLDDGGSCDFASVDLTLNKDPLENEHDRGYVWRMELNDGRRGGETPISASVFPRQ